MKETINMMKNRMSVRQFDPNRPITQEILTEILQAVQQSPTYVTGQQYSIIVVDDKAKREKIANATISSAGKPMSFIHEAPILLLFVIDFNKIDHALAMEKQESQIINSIESLLIGTVDIGIALEAATVAAESLGLGTVAVGALRKITPNLIEDFALPPHTFPLVGLSIGYPKQDIIPTPRLPLDSLIHYNVYEKKDYSAFFQEYNTIMKDYYRIKRGVDMNWTEYVSKSYSKLYGVELLDLYKKQGFNI